MTCQYDFANTVLATLDMELIVHHLDDSMYTG